MKMTLSKLFMSFLLGLGLTGTALSWEHVSSDQFKSTIDSSDVTLVAFTLPWSEASKALEPEWVFAAAQSEMPLISIDCSIEAKLCKENKVISYPAIRLFRGSDSVTRYRGQRTASALVPFVNRAKMPTLSTLDEKNITAFKSVDEIVFIAYLAPQDVELRSVFTTLAIRNHHRFTFGITASARCIGADKVASPSIVCYKMREGEQEILSEVSCESGIDALEAFIETATAPLIGQMTRRNEMKYLKASKSLIYIFALKEHERSAYRASLKPLAKKYQDYIHFVTVDAMEYSYMAPMLGLQSDVFPALSLLNPMYGQVFSFDQRKRITIDAVENFVLDIVEGRVQPSTNEQGEKRRTHNEL